MWAVVVEVLCTRLSPPDCDELICTVWAVVVEVLCMQLVGLALRSW